MSSTTRVPRRPGPLARLPVGLPVLLLRINRTAVSVAIGIVFLAIVGGSFFLGLENLEESTRAQVQVLAENASAAIRRNDPAAAQNLLASLRHAPQVERAVLLDKDHRAFAFYAGGRTVLPPADLSRGFGSSAVDPFLLQYHQDFGDAEGRAGTLLLGVSVEPLLRQTAWIAVITLAAAVVAYGVSNLLLRHLDHSVIGPLQALNGLMAQVHGRSDYTVRARRTHIVEIDALGKGFNEMIEKIHDRDQQLARLAFTDGLTGLSNRPAFMDRVEREVQRARRGNHRLGLLFLDLDGFKQVNDTQGHETGDRLLVEAAARIRESLRPADATARSDAPPHEPHPARLGGDEFTVLLPDLRHADDVLVVARRIGDNLRRPFYIGGKEQRISASIGAAVFPDDGADVPTLLKNADTAMYDAKRCGRDNSRRYNAALAAPVTHRPGRGAEQAAGNAVP